MNVSCITKQQIVYEPVDAPSSGSISGSKSLSRSFSWADASRVKDSEQGREVCKYVLLASKLMSSRG
jgi:hypothetical protein